MVLKGMIVFNEASGVKPICDYDILHVDTEQFIHQWCIISYQISHYLYHYLHLHFNCL